MPKVYNKRDGNVPVDAVYVGRPTKWGNPFVIGRDGDRTEVVTRFEIYLQRSGLVREVEELRGKDLVCWCAPLDCHADVLLVWANAE